MERKRRKRLNLMKSVAKTGVHKLYVFAAFFTGYYLHRLQTIFNTQESFSDFSRFFSKNTVKIPNKRHLELLKNVWNKGFFCLILGNYVQFWPFWHQIMGQIRDFVSFYGVPYLDFPL